jgi:hypothetical protein
MHREICFAIILSALFLATTVKAMECGTHSLPTGAQTALEHYLPNWKIVELDDLNPEDKKPWSENYADKCPGLIEGEFATPHSYAVTLILSSPGSLTQMLVLLEPAATGYKLRTLSEASQTAFPDVLLKLPRGVYSDAERTYSVKTNSDGIGYIHLEAGGVLYYATEGGFKSLVISE